MSGIRAQDTRPEVRVRRYLHAEGLRFRLHDRKLPGTPDIVLPKYRVVVLVHGCYWHRHENCHLSYSPKTNVRFWEQKFAANVERDSRTQVALAQAGWRVIVVWECQTRLAAKYPDVIAKIRQAG